ncbi:MAG TPA: porphobilinogen synthase [Acidobacteria bacterium]|nr:porphobilinogen synthase [Acidobacteriota bacterium]HIM15359.1 porphobilinogen synthase [Acidobacteriota bacterium]
MTSKNPTAAETAASNNLFLRRRPRRLRRSPAIRDVVRETKLSPEDLIYPLFACPGSDVRQEVPSMPGVFQLSVDQVVVEATAAATEGVRGVLLFGLPESKDSTGSAADNSTAPVQSAIRAIKKEIPGLLVITDVCLCEYTSHGHCGIIDGTNIVNDATVNRLTSVAVSHAEAGADLVAPSDMMDGRIGAIRDALDINQFDDVGIMAYAAKYCSAYYGPFRDAADSTPAFGDRRTHQMDPANVDEALREVELDLEEGADIVMVKPALHYLDVIARVKSEFRCPTAAYHVSGEYSMLKAAALNGWIDESRAMLEALTSIKRAGADILVTYYAREAARLLV